MALSHRTVSGPFARLLRSEATLEIKHICGSDLTFRPNHSAADETPSTRCLQQQSLKGNPKTSLNIGGLWRGYYFAVMLVTSFKNGVLMDSGFEVLVRFAVGKR